MFERYTEKARRVIFFARYEASQFGSACIDTEHILLGIAREDQAFFKRLGASFEDVRKAAESKCHPGVKIATSIDLPLSHQAVRALAYGAEESEHLGHKIIAPAHLLLGLLREADSTAAEILKERGIGIAQVRELLLMEDRPDL